jgi:hypothetical protein
MISLKVIDVKAFMSSLLVHNVFDNFLLTELEINSYNHFSISGKLNEEYYSSDELEELAGRKYSTWNEIKPVAYSLIKGHKQPLSIKIVFLLSPSNTEKTLNKTGLGIRLEEVNGLYLNIKYEKGNLYIITGTSIRTFTLDKSLEHEWDANVKTFLKHFEIAVEEV